MLKGVGAQWAQALRSPGFWLGAGLATAGGFASGSTMGEASTSTVVNEVQVATTVESEVVTSTAEQQASAPVLFENRYPEDVVGGPLQSWAPKDLMLPRVNRVMNYVVTEDGHLYIGRRNSQQVGGGHIDLANGKPVLAAGEVKVVGGKVSYVDNTSGHYMPHGSSARKAALEAFKNAGFGDVTYIEYEWVNGKKIVKR